MRGVPAVRITPRAMKSCGRRSPSWVAQTCGAASGERGRATGERGRGERSASEEVGRSPAQGLPQPWGPPLEPAPLVLCGMFPRCHLVGEGEGFLPSAHGCSCAGGAHAGPHAGLSELSLGNWPRCGKSR